MTKAAIFFPADTQIDNDLGRVANALAAAQEFKEAGDRVTKSSLFNQEQDL